MADGQRGGLIDLEKELTCSICTDVLYQPLTLLDCLHTFCGACLKEWFHFQALSANSSSSRRNSHPYTCPSCRASVRGTKPNATVTTLLDMFLSANPGRGKSEQEKEEMRRQYKPGDNVLPKIKRRGGATAEEDRRVLEEVRELSLREVGVSSGRSPSLEEPRATRSRNRSRERDREGRPRRTGDSSRARHGGTYLNYRPDEHERHQASSRSDILPRQVEHQSSLRSLLSASELDSHEMEEEIMRQIIEEGLLDGIDLNNIDVLQEDEISERIAQAYRRRQRERQRERQTREMERGDGNRNSVDSTRATVSSRSNQREEELPQRRLHGRSESSVPHESAQSSRPPVSRPHLFDAANNPAPRTRRRSASQGTTSSASTSQMESPSRRHRPPALSVGASRQAARSASDLAERPTTTDGNGGRRRRMSQTDRSTTDPMERRSVSAQWQTGVYGSTSHSNPNSPRRATFNVSTGSPANSPLRPAFHGTGESPTGSPRRANCFTAEAPTISPPTTGSHITTGSRAARSANNSSPSLPLPNPVLDSSSPNGRPSSSHATSTPTRLSLFQEPNISCNRCGKASIQYDVHYNCQLCEDGTYNVCVRCYRQGKGCLHWYGFGYAAWARYERQAPPGGYPLNHEFPHVLAGHRYVQPKREAIAASAAPIIESRTVLTHSDPSTRLQVGVFCDICCAFANNCYWKCDVCNDGDWGYCNACVNQGRHCTHPLQPLAHKPSSSVGDNNSPKISPTSSSPHLAPTSPTAGTPPLTPKSASLIRGAVMSVMVATLPFRPLSFTTRCDLCSLPIPPSSSRYHCPRCSGGDYDVCVSCYHGLVVSYPSHHPSISPENGPQGWRKCPQGHRMQMVGFEDRAGGQRRVVVRDLVGGWALKEEETAGRSAAESGSVPPPVGAKWSWREGDGTLRNARDRQLHPPKSPSLAALGAGQYHFVPPDGGGGLRAVALWSYWSNEGVSDELTFPKGAEIREAEDINGDWFWGVYAGSKGLFPGGYVRVLQGGGF